MASFGSQTAQSRAFCPVLVRCVHSAGYPLQRWRSDIQCLKIKLVQRARGGQTAIRALGPDPSSVQAQPGLSPELRDALENFISSHKVVLFMKGTKQFPQCGFSNTCVQILNTLNVPYETVNILEDDRLRSGMKEFSQWPTFPQVYINGEFYGGCDIMIEAYTNGELVETLEAAINS